MKVSKDILAAIGNTPLVKLNKVIPKHVTGNLYVKCEFMNPGGSVKDRIGVFIIEEAERKNQIKPGATVVEATSGNTGMGVAIACAVKGYKCVFVMPDKMSREKIVALRAFGARVIVTPTNVEPDDPRSYYSVAKLIATTTPNAFYVNQYHNTDNRLTHYKSTGPEIYNDMDGKLDAFVAGMGTCGTITGIGMYLKEKNKNIKIVGADPEGSILKEFFETKKMGIAHPYKIEGIGEDIIPQNFDANFYDEIIRVQDKEAYIMCRRLLLEEGIFTGSSAGAAIVGAIKWMEKNPGKTVVSLLPDSGNRYLSKAHDEAWLREQGLSDENNAISQASELLQTAQTITTVHVKDSIGQVVEKMKKLGISQAPVVREANQPLTTKNIMGVIQEKDLMSMVVQGLYALHDPISPLVKEVKRIHSLQDPVAEVSKTISEEKFALLKDRETIVGIITPTDILNFYSRRP